MIEAKSNWGPEIMKKVWASTFFLALYLLQKKENRETRDTKENSGTTGNDLPSLFNPYHVANSPEHQRSGKDHEKPELMCKNEMSIILGCIRRLRFNEA